MGQAEMDDMGIKIDGFTLTKLIYDDALIADNVPAAGASLPYTSEGKRRQPDQ